MPDLGPAVNTVISRCLAVQADEDVLVVCDPATHADRRGAAGRGAQLGAEAVLALMDEREIDGTEPPRPSPKR